MVANAASQRTKSVHWLREESDGLKKYRQLFQIVSVSSVNGQQTVKRADKELIALYLNGIIISLAGFRISLVRHEPCLQQVLVKTVPQPSNWGMIWRGREKQRVKRVGWKKRKGYSVTEQEKKEKQTARHGQRRQSELLIFWLCLKVFGRHMASKAFCLPVPWCAHISESPIVLMEVYTAFMTVLICRAPHSEDGMLPALNHTSHLQNNFFSPEEVLSTLDEKCEGTFASPFVKYRKY